MRLSHEGRNLPALLAEINRRYGSEANIVDTERTRVGGFLGFFSKELFKIVVEVPNTTLVEVSGFDSPADTPGDDMSPKFSGLGRQNSSSVNSALPDDIDVEANAVTNQTMPAARSMLSSLIEAAEAAERSPAGHSGQQVTSQRRPSTAPVMDIREHTENDIALTVDEESAVAPRDGDSDDVAAVDPMFSHLLNQALGQDYAPQEAQSEPSIQQHQSDPAPATQVSMESAQPPAAQSPAAQSPAVPPRVAQSYSEFGNPTTHPINLLEDPVAVVDLGPSEPTGIAERLAPQPPTPAEPEPLSVPTAMPAESLQQVPAPPIPHQGSSLQAHVTNRGLPAHLGQQLPTNATVDHLLPIIQNLPAAPKFVQQPGTVAVVLSMDGQEPEIAQRLAQQLSGGICPAVAVEPSSSPEQGQSRAKAIRDKQVVGVVEVAIGAWVNAEDDQKPAMISAIDPDLVVVVVDARRKHADVLHGLDKLRRSGVPVDAIAVIGSQETQEPATVIGLGVPVWEIDGALANNLSWLPLLLVGYR